MARYILDTNIVSQLQQRNTTSLKIVEKLQNLDMEDEVSVSVIVLYELVYGLENISDSEQKESVEEGITFIKEYLSVIPLDLKEVEIFAKLKRAYRLSTGIHKNAIKRHNLDFLIASTAIAIDAILVSSDAIFQTLSEIEPQLKYENWAV